jgi:hypothetical protein
MEEVDPIGNRWALFTLVAVAAAYKVVLLPALVAQVAEVMQLLPLLLHQVEQLILVAVVVDLGIRLVLSMEEQEEVA